jgi:hypothetical protein
MEAIKRYRSHADTLRRRAAATKEARAATAMRGLADGYDGLADARAARAWIFLSLERRAFGGCAERTSDLYRARAE